MTYEDFISLPQVRASFRRRNSAESGQYICPGHTDKEPSLTVSRGRKGGVTLFCHGGCSTEKVVEAWGLKMCDLMPDNNSNNGNVPRWRAYVEGRKKKRIEAVYDYRNINSGEYEYTKIRLEGKDFTYGILKNDRFSFGLNGLQRKNIPAMYCRSFTGVKKAIEEGKPVFYVEGEKDVNSLYSRGYAAVTCGAAKDWSNVCADLFRGADVVILADNDRPGVTLANGVKADLQSVAKSVKIVLPCPDVEHGDVSDYFAAGHSKEEFEKLIQDEFKESIESIAGNESNDFKENKEFKRKPGYLDRFHLFNDNGKITGVFDYAIFEHLKAEHNIFVLGGTPYLYEGGVYVPDETGAKLKTMIRELIYPAYIKSTTIKRVYELFITAAELQATFEDVNQYPPHWINFQNGFYDTKTGRMEPHKPEYRAINQIPHEYRPEATPEGGAVEAWLRFICPEADDREMLLQFMGLTMTTDVSQQKFLVLCGEGGSGKSTLIRLNEAMTGSRNVSNISLTELQQRFASFGLMGKLLNSCADLEISALEDTSVLKKCLGEDTLRGEQKGKDAISFKSYAKLIFSTNELPLVISERTNGFYRRLLVLPMDRVPERKNADLFSELAAQIDYFIKLSVEALGRMYKAGTITESRASVAAVSQLRCDSDTVQAYIVECCSLGSDFRADRAAMYRKYDQYCQDNDRTALKKTAFFKSVRSKGFAEYKSNGEWYFKGISLEKKIPDDSPKNSPDGFIELPEGYQEELPFD